MASTSLQGASLPGAAAPPTENAPQLLGVPSSVTPQVVSLDVPLDSIVPGAALENSQIGQQGSSSRHQQMSDPSSKQVGVLVAPDVFGQPANSSTDSTIGGKHLLLAPGQTSMAPSWAATEPADIPTKSKFYSADALVKRKIAEGSVLLMAGFDDDLEWGVQVEDALEDTKLLASDVDNRHNRLYEVDSRCLEELKDRFNAAGKFDSEPCWREQVLQNGDEVQMAELRCIAFMGAPNADSEGVGRGLALVTKVKPECPGASTHRLHLFLLEEEASFEGSEQWGEQRCCCIPLVDKIKMSHKSQHEQALSWSMTVLERDVLSAHMTVTEKSTLLSQTDRMRELPFLPKLPCCSCWPPQCAQCCPQCPQCCPSCGCCDWKKCFGSGGTWSNSAKFTRQIDELTERIGREIKEAEAVLPNMGPHKVQYYQKLEAKSFRCIRIAVVDHVTPGVKCVTLVAHPMEEVTKVMSFAKLLGSCQAMAGVASTGARQQQMEQAAATPIPVLSGKSHKPPLAFRLCCPLCYALSTL